MPSEFTSHEDTESDGVEQSVERLLTRLNAEINVERPIFTPPDVPPSLEALDTLTNQLASSSKSQREMAAAKLKQLGPLATDSLLGVIEFEAKKRNQRIQNVKIIAGGMVGIVIALVIILTLFTKVPAGGFLAFLGMLGLAGAAATLSPRHLRTAAAVALLDDKRAIPYLAELALFRNPTLKGCVPQALERLMPLVTEEDTNLLSMRQRQLIAQYVTTYPANIRFARIACRMLGNIAGREVFTFLKIAEGHRYEGSPWREVATLAAETRVRIEARLERESKEDSLLRPAVSPQDSELLRPAGPGDMEDPALLLRPTTNLDDL